MSYLTGAGAVGSLVYKPDGSWRYSGEELSLPNLQVSKAGALQILPLCAVRSCWRSWA